MTEALRALGQLVETQIDDEGLWFIDANMAEGYLQQELRKLHAAVEAALAQPAGEPRCDADHECKPYAEAALRFFPDKRGVCSVHGGKFPAAKRETE